MRAALRVESRRGAARRILLVWAWVAAASLKAPISLLRVGAIMREQHGINSGLGFARCAGMTAFGYIAAFSMIGAILVASTSFTDRRSVKTWAPSTVVLKP